MASIENGKYNGAERRQPLAGISRQTFMDNATKAFGEDAKPLFGMLYDISSCQSSQIALANDNIENNRKVVVAKISAIEQQCSCRMAECQDMWDQRFIRKAKIMGKYWPISFLSIFIISCAVCLAIGLGIIEVTNIIDLKGLTREIIKSLI